ncbi:MAG: hypothetical protein KF773_23590 [Deltaproteobacteria bacterium]|nr:hypothetical protein [Deltaproteobacteria bacterium]
MTTRLPLGMHAADRVTWSTLSNDKLELRGGGPEHRRMTYTRQGQLGNVVLTTGPGWNVGGSWTDKVDGRTWHMPGRNELAPGRYETMPWNDRRACGKLAFDVAPGDHITYVYVDAGPRTPEGCQPLVVKVQKLAKSVFP